MLISDVMLEQNRIMHRKGGFGGGGHKRADEVMAFAVGLDALSIVDYGCGEGRLAPDLRARGFAGEMVEYDPAVAGKESLPGAGDLVVCTDVLEHAEEECLPDLLGHLRLIARRGCFVAVATRKSNKTLPDGRNSHLIVRDAAWWIDRVASLPWKRFHAVARTIKGEPREVKLWLRT